MIHRKGLNRSSTRNYRIGSVGNWPLNTTERWMRAAVTQDHSQERLDKLREIRYGGLNENLTPCVPIDRHGLSNLCATVYCALGNGICAHGLGCHGRPKMARNVSTEHTLSLDAGVASVHSSTFSSLRCGTLKPPSTFIAQHFNAFYSSSAPPPL